MHLQEEYTGTPSSLQEEDAKHQLFADALWRQTTPMA